MTVVSDYVVYVGGTAWDLRKVSSVVEPADKPAEVWVRFLDNPANYIVFERFSFLAAYQVALDASLGSGGPPSGSAGGDLTGTYPNPKVRQVTPVSKALTYNLDGSLNTVTDSWGTKTMAYDGQGMLSSVTGTGIYRSKVLNYASGQLTSVTVS